MYYVNRYPQVKNPLVPIFTTNAKYISAGFTITAPNGIITGNNPFDPFDGNNWKSADTTNSYLEVQFPQTCNSYSCFIFSINSSSVFNYQIQGSNTGISPWASNNKC